MGGWRDIIKDPEDLKQVIADTKEPLFLVYYADVSKRSISSILRSNGKKATLTLSFFRSGALTVKQPNRF